jgi:hypothetical protein
MKALAVLCVLASSAYADRVDLPKTKATLDVPAGWTRHESKSAVVVYKHAGTVLAVARVDTPNPDAWKPKTRDAYLTEIEGGLSGGARRLARKIHEVNGVPALDLELANKDGTIVVLRVLVFRTYALTVGISVPKGTALDQARAIRATFAPPKGT